MHYLIFVRGMNPDCCIVHVRRAAVRSMDTSCQVSLKVQFRNASQNGSETPVCLLEIALYMSIRSAATKGTLYLGRCLLSLVTRSLRQLKSKIHRCFNDTNTWVPMAKCLTVIVIKRLPYLTAELEVGASPPSKVGPSQHPRTCVSLYQSNLL